MSVRIISDSTCDLSRELIEKYQINILPLHVVLGDTEYKDGSEIRPEDIYRWSDEHKTTPKTSAPAIEDVMALMQVCTADGSEAVCFSISDKMSTTGNVMRMAAAELELEDRVFVVDSANLSTGVGLLVVKAAEMAGAGKSAGEIVEAMEALKLYVRASFVVDTLTYLYRGGRCSGLAALAGSALKLHPKIVVADGGMSPTQKYRGNISKVILNYARDLEEQLKNARPERVFITHSGCGEEIIEAVRQYLEGLGIFDEILVTRAGGVISSHCGPGTLGVLFIEKSE
ncbi:MAG: DegV family protein [Lachnospiraceae bacterium]|nr:DegV family protein [Lachnospiraceae bacterium]